MTFSTLTPAVCAVSGTRVTGVAAGTCKIAANQAGNGIYAAAPAVQQSIPIVKQPQTIDFAPIHDVSLSVKVFSVSARTSSGLPVTVSSLTTLVCTVTKNQAHLLALGTCSLQASQPGNAQFAPAVPVERSFKVLR